MQKPSKRRRSPAPHARRRRAASAPRTSAEQETRASSETGGDLRLEFVAARAEVGRFLGEDCRWRDFLCHCPLAARDPFACGSRRQHCSTYLSTPPEKRRPPRLPAAAIRAANRVGADTRAGLATGELLPIVVKIAAEMHPGWTLGPMPASPTAADLRVLRKELRRIFMEAPPR